MGFVSRPNGSSERRDGNGARGWENGEEKVKIGVNKGKENRGEREEKKKEGEKIIIIINGPSAAAAP